MVCSDMNKISFAKVYISVDLIIPFLVNGNFLKYGGTVFSKIISRSIIDCVKC